MHHRYHSLVHKETVFYSLCLSSVMISQVSVWYHLPLEIDFAALAALVYQNTLLESGVQSKFVSLPQE